ncbi:MAG: tetratricopeptide repeat protein [Candidatus Rokubacteria bacterium]|nr:tetratricopeptide repeat protein [Candidatus Rokubacteria bacterium]
MPSDDLAAQIRRAEERIARDPKSLAFAQLADLYRKAGRTADAIAACRQGLARYPQYATARLILAKALAADGAVAEALSEVETILAATPAEAGAHRLAADLERQRGRIDAAARHLEAVVKVDPGDRDARSLLGLLRADPAASDASALLRVLRDDTFVTASFGAVCLDQGATEEAAVLFTRLLRTDPEHRGAREGLEAAMRGRSRRKG